MRGLRAFSLPANAAILLLLLSLSLGGHQVQGSGVPIVEFNATSLTMAIHLGPGSTLRVAMDEVGLRVKGQWYTVGGAGGLSLLHMSARPEEGQDNLGYFDRTTVTWASAAGPRFETNVRVYREWPALIFEQIFPDGTWQATTDDQDQVVSSFPAFSGADAFFDDKAYLTFARNMGCSNGDLDCAPVGSFREDMHALAEVDGQQGGVPLVVFEANMQSTLVISPANTFMATSMYFDDTSTTLKWGLQGKVDEVPAGVTVETMLWVGQGGVNSGVEGWGRAMRQLYQVHHPIEDDMTVNYLSYYTDNGAYYYYLTEEGKSYEETLLEVWGHAREEGIPYRSLQIDSWWYYRGADGGVSLWDARPEVFPTGLHGLQEKLGGVPIIAHNRWWSVETEYAQQNGGDYAFNIERIKEDLPGQEVANVVASERARSLRLPTRRRLNDDVSPLPYGAAMPLEQRFWDDLFARARTWGLHTYEQDWLHNEFLSLNATLSTVDKARTWLLQMGQAALRHGLMIQYCMAFPRFYLQTLEVRAVTHIRASDDYGPGDRPDQWYMGDTSLLAHALGLAPFKDVFWSSVEQAGNKYNATEQKPNLEAAISTLSTGPVAVGDRIGSTDRELVMRSANQEGLILKPSRPATPIDATYIKRAFGKDGGGGPEGVVLATHSVVGGLTWDIILGAVLSQPYRVSPKDLDHLSVPTSLSPPGSRVVYQVERGSTAQPGGISFLHSLNSDQDDAVIVLEPCGRADFELAYTAPVASGGLILLGELAKWVPVSPQRVVGLESTGDTMEARVKGAVGEAVTLHFACLPTLTTTQPLEITCLVPQSGQVTFTVTIGSSGGHEGSPPHLQATCHDG